MAAVSSHKVLHGGLTMAALESALLSTPEDSELIRRYFDAAVSSRQLDRAKSFFEKLLTCYPNRHQIRTLYISLCLQLKEYHAAMEAIETLVAFSTPDDALLDAALNVRAKIGPRSFQQADRPGIRLSVCMIARNEQRYLASCLNSIKKVAAEIVLVDTGSEDRTADIARIFGARVGNIQWCDDFAAARNVGLEQAEGDWILILDADEMIAEQDHNLLKKLLSDHCAAPAAFSMETRNYTHNGNVVKWQSNDGRYPLCEAGIGWFPSTKIRLFPNHPEIRFQFPVHELVDPTVRSAGIPVKECTIPIHHYGHLNETRNRKKAEAYFKLGYAKLDLLGNDVAAIRELAVQAGQLELWSEAMRLWQRLLKIRPEYIEAFVNLSGASWQLGHYQAALDYAQKALDRQPGLKEAHYNLAVSHMMLGRPREAFAILSVLHKKHPGYLGAQFMSAAAAACMGDHQTGRALFDALKRSPVGAATVFGIQDLIKRLRQGGREEDAKQLERATERFRAANGN